MRFSEIIAKYAPETWASIRGVALGTTATTACAGNDARLANSRTPTAHASTHATGGSDPVTPAAIGAATAAQGALADTAVQSTRTVNGHALSANVTVTAGDVGLGNVNNTADVDKPLSNATQTALAGKAALAGSASQAFSTPTAASGSNTTLAASTAFVQAAIPVVSWYFKLSATGTGAGVATLQLTCTAPTTLTITGGGKFYTDSAGTAGETASRNLVVGLNTIYIKVTAGSSYCKVAQGEFISQINGWTSGTNAPSIKFKLSSLPSGITYVSIGGSNTISGSLADLPSGVTYVSIGGSNTISGSLADLPSGITYVAIYGSNTISGSLANLPSGVTYVYIYGSNTCTYNTVSGSRTWASGMRAVYNRPATGVMTSAMIDALLIDLAAQATWSNEKAINIKGTRTSASDAAVTTLTGYGVAVTVN